MAVKVSKERDAVNKGSLEVPVRSKKKKIFNGRIECSGGADKISKEHGVVDEGSLEVP